MLYRFAISAPTCFAIATQSSIVTPSMGMKGTTSAAPMRGCAPRCLVRSIRATAFSTARKAASATAGGGLRDGKNGLHDGVYFGGVAAFGKVGYTLDELAHLLS